ncbi:hypothetical protein HUW46_06924 [Amycolatopsis sp. CA-230715]|nr:hypothetical protein HUW46_06924 [Amycolatopsis sp. CA-230715]
MALALCRPAGRGTLAAMTTYHALNQAAILAQDLEAKGFLGTVGKIAAATIIFFIAIGLIVGLLLGFFIGRAVGRRQSQPRNSDQNF